MSRLNIKTPDKLDEQERAQFLRISKFRRPDERGQFGGPFDPWMRSPELARRGVSFGNFIWERTTLEPRIIELAIIMTGRFWEADVEWVSHSAKARDAGVSDEVIRAVFERTVPVDAPEDEVLTIEVCRALQQSHRLDAELYERAVAVFGERGLVEMIATVGYYTLVAMTLKAFDVGLPGGVAGPFSVGRTGASD